MIEIIPVNMAFNFTSFYFFLGLIKETFTYIPVLNYRGNKMHIHIALRKKYSVWLPHCWYTIMYMQNDVHCMIKFIKLIAYYCWVL